MFFDKAVSRSQDQLTDPVDDIGAFPVLGIDLLIYFHTFGVEDIVGRIGVYIDIVEAFLRMEDYQFVAEMCLKSLKLFDRFIADTDHLEFLVG